MTLSRFAWLTSLAALSAALAIATVVMAAINQDTQQKLEDRQAAINKGILGPQGQQLGNAILRDMANAAVTNRPIRELLEKHGYTVQTPGSTAKQGDAQ